MITPASSVITPSHGAIIGGATGNAKEPATVLVKAADGVKITVNGQATPRSSTEETFQTPGLESGRTYSYTFVAESTRDGKTISETRKVTVQAGRQSVVDFSTLGEEKAVAKAETETATVTVILPEGARLTVNDVAVNATGKQTFNTPKLEKGKSYFYTVKAELNRDGRPATETRRVDVAAGKAVTVDFTKGTATLTASR